MFKWISAGYYIYSQVWTTPRIEFSTADSITYKYSICLDILCFSFWVVLVRDDSKLLPIDNTPSIDV